MNLISKQDCGSFGVIKKNMSKIMRVLGMHFQLKEREIDWEENRKLDSGPTSRFGCWHILIQSFFK